MNRSARRGKKACMSSAIRRIHERSGTQMSFVPVVTFGWPDCLIMLWSPAIVDLTPIGELQPWQHGVPIQRLARACDRLDRRRLGSLLSIQRRSL